MVEVPTMSEFLELKGQVETLNVELVEFMGDFNLLKRELLRLVGVVKVATDGLLVELEDTS